MITKKKLQDTIEGLTAQNEQFEMHIWGNLKMIEICENEIKEIDNGVEQTGNSEESA